MARILARGARALPVVLLGVCAIGCGGGEESTPAARHAQARPAPAADGENSPPVIESVSLAPEVLLPGHPVRAVVEATDPDGDRVQLRYAWQRNGSVLGDATSDITPREAAKGDEITLIVTASDGRADSEPVTVSERIANRPPVLFAVALEGAETIAPGHPLVASPRADDPDGDEMSFEFTWRVNGEAVEGAGPEFPTEGLKRGDRIEVDVVASDGDDESEAKTSAPVTVANTPPRFVTDAQWRNVGGEMQYSAEAEDPDGDRSLRYRLLKAPENMQIDAIRGEVRWRPTASQKGKHAVEIEVDDLRGGRTVQSFEMSVDVEQAVADAEPPRPVPLEPAPEDEFGSEADADEAAAEEGGATAEAPPAPRRQRRPAPAPAEADAEGEEADAGLPAARDANAEKGEEQP